MKKVVASLLIILLLWSEVFAFCGFYVAGAGAKLYNKSSQVIIAREGDKTVVTMESDFTGDVKQFAMVVPVPTVLKKEQIRVLKDDALFSKLDQYSAPRIVEYHDANPCEPNPDNEDADFESSSSGDVQAMRPLSSESPQSKVRIEAQYEIGEYSILILSADESGALARWLTANKYNIPPKAKEVLEPYIKNNLKFFVVKVNLAKLAQGKQSKLRPIQIEYNYNKFMLPIRLGMANATEAQDLTVYAFSKVGRIECSNYRTIEVPTDKYIPLRIKDQFAKFYKYVFENQYFSAKKAGVFVEYTWDLSGSNSVLCDPCPVEPPVASDLKEAGVFWLKYFDTLEERYYGKAYLTRLHLRYDRPNFPEDLMFIHTPNTINYQARYIVTHDAQGDLSCEAGLEYEDKLRLRKEFEENTLAFLIGWSKKDKKPFDSEKENKDLIPLLPTDDTDFSPPQNGIFRWIAFGLGMLLLIYAVPYITRLPHHLNHWRKRMIS